MKRRLFFALAIVALAFPMARQATADTDVSIDFFYNNLNDGSWIDVADYGYCWQPNVAVGNNDWRPYADGYWAYTDVGWTWISNEDFGWATYHYGRWIRLAGEGWVWVPGYEWGPAWVSWRTGGDYIGWAPLPPGAERVYEGRAITGHVDVEFDIGPACYNFVDIRYIGDPRLRTHIYAPTQNVTYISQTVNVTNITYNNSRVYNYGPDYDRLNRYSSRPIQRLNLERETRSNFNGQVHGREITRIQGNRLVVAAPMKIRKPAKQVAPRAVKTKIEHPKLERGWSDVKDPKEKSQLEQKMKTENARNVPPPNIKPNKSEATGKTSQGTPAAGAASQEAAQSKPENGRRGQRGKQAETAPQAKATPSANEKAKAKDRKADRGEQTPAPANGREKQKEGGRHNAAPGNAAKKNETPSPNERKNKMLHQPKPQDQRAAKERGPRKEKEAASPEQAHEQPAQRGGAENAARPQKQNQGERKNAHNPQPAARDNNQPGHAGGKSQERGHGDEKKKGGEPTPGQD